MNKLVSYIVFFFSALTVSAQQNLVPNPSFEEYNWCPSFTDGFYINACKYWTSPSLGSPDYFNACSQDYDNLTETYMFSVPENYYGNQNAHSGNAYGGFVFGQNEVGSLTYSEYVQIELNSSLEKDKFYEVVFFINNPRFDCCLNSLGVLFTQSILNLNTDQVITIEPQILTDPEVFFCDTNSWIEVRNIFIASGDEKYLTIGVFKKLPELQAIDYQGNPILEFPTGYFYIDDVSVIEKEFQVTNVFTPDGDGVNDSYYLNLESIGAKEAEIVNRWGNVVASGTTILSWDGTFSGNECSEGVYFLRIRFENNETSGFIHLVR